ncbi:MAG TPA: LLM class flavin-dependent oxidoreductase [Chloroflexota bacterium]|jgi:alkanesulfonate monooxygenase SsuD/methylene tetrahydromethanopterin reductase-like flavin-dependent oxidoreductase (luciferase family)|nr:LLM class flavin-dependent oxidoreductase [Chloroflexota bacterium]
MKLGLFTMPLHPPEVPKHEGFQRDIDLLIRADRLGLSEAWIGEHYASAWESVPAPDLLIARALGETSQIKFGTGVACLPHHNPIELAHRIAYLDHLARGRLLFGIGPGGLMVDHELFCIDTEHDEQRQLTEAVIDAVLDVWTGPSSGEWQTDRWHFKVPQTTSFGLGLHLRPYQQPHPPIGVAGVSPGSGSLGLASERGWIPLSLNFLTPAGLADHGRVIDEGALRAGRDADRSVWRVCRDIHVAQTTKQAIAEARDGAMGRAFREYVLPLVRSTGRVSVFKASPDMPDDDVDVDYLVENIWIVGDPPTVTAKLQRLYDEIGGFGTLIQLCYDWEPVETGARSMELLANEVLPKLP